MMPGMQGGMPGMMGLDKQYQMGYKPQPSMPQGQILRQQLQVRLVSRSTLTGQATPSSRVELTETVASQMEQNKLLILCLIAA